MSTFKQPVAMKVTLEQYESDLKEPLLRLGYVWDTVNTPKEDFEGKYNYLTTNYLEYNKSIAGDEEHSVIKNSYVIKDYNPKLFLAIAGMTTDSDWQIGEYLCYKDRNILFEVRGMDMNSYINNQATNLCVSYRKATLSELISKFETTKDEQPAVRVFFHMRFPKNKFKLFLKQLVENGKQSFLINGARH